MEVVIQYLRTSSTIFQVNSKTSANSIDISLKVERSWSGNGYFLSSSSNSVKTSDVLLPRSNNCLNKDRSIPDEAGSLKKK